MKHFYERFLKSDFATSSIYSAIATGIKMLTMLLMSKIVAVFLGPDGIGLIGQLSNFVMITAAIAGGAINIGVVKYVAEYAAAKQEALPRFIATCFTVLFWLSLAVAFPLVVFSSFWANTILNDTQFRDVFILQGFTLYLFGLNICIVSVLNGLKKYRMLNMVNITTSLLGLCVSYILIVCLSTRGALYAIVANQSIALFVTLWITRKEELIRRSIFTFKGELSDIRRLSAFVLMTLVSTAAVPFVQLMIRNMVITDLGLSQAGIWESVSRISAMHLLFITTTLSTYYLPRLSEISSLPVLRNEVVRMLKVVMPFIITTSMAIFLFRNLLISLLFTADFQQGEALFKWQLIGDIFKAASWIIGYQMHAKAMTRTFIITELAGGALYFFLSVICLEGFGLIGASVAYALSYAVYLFGMIFVFRKTLLSSVDAL
jgi:PST family polysaccharide transporter